MAKWDNKYILKILVYHVNYVGIAYSYNCMYTRINLGVSTVYNLILRNLYWTLWVSRKDTHSLELS